MLSYRTEPSSATLTTHAGPPAGHETSTLPRSSDAPGATVNRSIATSPWFAGAAAKSITVDITEDITEGTPPVLSYRTEPSSATLTTHAGPPAGHETSTLPRSSDAPGATVNRSIATSPWFAGAAAKSITVDITDGMPPVLSYRTEPSSATLTTHAGPPAGHETSTLPRSSDAPGTTVNRSIATSPWFAGAAAKSITVDITEGMPPVLSYRTEPSSATLTTHAGPPAGHETSTLPRSSDAPGATVNRSIATSPWFAGAAAKSITVDITEDITEGTPPVLSYRTEPSSATLTTHAGPPAGHETSTLPRSSDAPGATVNRSIAASPWFAGAAAKSITVDITEGMPPVLSYRTEPSSATLTTHAGPPAGHETSTLPRSSDAPGATVNRSIATSPWFAGAAAKSITVDITEGMPPVLSYRTEPSSATLTTHAGPPAGHETSTLPRSSDASGATVNRSIATSPWFAGAAARIMVLTSIGGMGVESTTEPVLPLPPHPDSNNANDVATANSEDWILPFCIFLSLARWVACALPFRYVISPSSSVSQPGFQLSSANP